MKRLDFFELNKPTVGFTLVELMVVVAIAAILLTVAVPSFVETSARAVIRSSVVDLAADLSFARSAAVTRSESVSVCPSNESITPRACNNGAWNQGWMVFYDLDEDGDLDTGEEVVRVASAFGAKVDVTLDNTVTFDSKGAKKTVSEFVFCSSRSSNATFTRSLVVNIGGLVRGSRDTDSNGIHNSGEGGSDLVCP
ncbi:GspH/FimT family pseudopilin [Teredinibacter haidensis]|uniref:GspH/FimT family pseudopilin n=1 Tax=Teredinibacter haidensis TaxID=2731755 RepID=UPI000948C46A|nr:GspH/FimT family pseudopilin [Teredinibacter haidensis]